MDQILDIQLFLDKGTLTAIDHTFDRLPDNATTSYHQHYYNVEFLTYQKETEPLQVMVNAVKDMRAMSTFNIPKSGVYYYYKMSIPLVDYFVGSEYSGNLIGEIFYTENGVLMQIASRPQEVTKEGIIAASKTIDLLTAYDAVMTNSSAETEANESYFFPKKELFNTWNLRKCLVYLQRKMLLGNCSFDDCSANKELRNQRDFLMSAIYVIDYLIDTNNLDEAQRIIDNLSTCGFPCEDNEFTFSDCGCGHTV